jgi:two-component system cell cycle response regulator DivK
MAAHALIIDDQFSNIDVLAVMLGQQGVTHTPISTTRQVIETVRSLDKIDVVFLDLEMPNSDYYELLNQLKAEPKLVGIPIVAYTVHTSEIDQARLAGFDSFLGKPLKLSEFPDQLRRILNGERVWSS